MADTRPPVLVESAVLQWAIIGRLVSLAIRDVCCNDHDLTATDAEQCGWRYISSLAEIAQYCESDFVWIDQQVHE
jgi:hypothetical protein